MAVLEGQAERSKEFATPSREVNVTEAAPANSLTRVRMVVVPTAADIPCPLSRGEYAMPFREGSVTEAPPVVSPTPRNLLVVTAPTIPPESRGSAATLLLATVTAVRVAGFLTSRNLGSTSGRKENGPEARGRPFARSPQDQLASVTPSSEGSVTAGPTADSLTRKAAPRPPKVSATLFREGNATVESLADFPMSERSANYE